MSAGPSRTDAAPASGGRGAGDAPAGSPGSPGYPASSGFPGAAPGPDAVTSPRDVAAPGREPADAGQPALPRASVGVLAVVGVGLIGGSFAAALRAAGQVDRVIGVGRQRATLERARELGLVDEILDAETAAAQADLIFVATPVGAMPAVLRAMAPHLRAHTVVTDGGSTKQDVIAAAREGLGERIAQFVPGHPIAGSERTGPDAASATLYRDRQVILTPLPENAAADVARVRAAWVACGARVSDMPADRHDAVLGSVSHLPHLVSAAYMAQVASHADDRMDYAGSGFRDFTRIAAGSAEMWRDILLANRDAVGRELAGVQAQLATCARLLAEGDADGLQAFLEDAAQARRGWRHD